MSQIWKSSTSSPSPPDVPTEFVTDDGSATPAANILNIFAASSSANNVNNIVTTGSGDTVSIILTNQFGQSTTTSGAVSSSVTILSGLAEGTYVFDIKGLAYSSASNSSNGYTLVGGVRSTGAAAVLLSGQARDNFEEAAGASVVLDVSGNDVIVTVTGAAGIDYDWLVAGEYKYVGI